jgi:hypothetical protein
LGECPEKLEDLNGTDDKIYQHFPVQGPSKSSGMQMHMYTIWQPWASLCTGKLDSVCMSMFSFCWIPLDVCNFVRQ